MCLVWQELNMDGCFPLHTINQLYSVLDLSSCEDGTFRIMKMVHDISYPKTTCSILTFQSPPHRFCALLSKAGSWFVLMWISLPSLYSQSVACSGSTSTVASFRLLLPIKLGDVMSELQSVVSVSAQTLTAMAYLFHICFKSPSVDMHLCGAVDVSGRLDKVTELSLVF